MEVASPPQPLPRTWPGRALHIWGVAFLFICTLLGSALIHLPTPVGRMLLTDGINAALDRVFVGTVRVGSVTRLGLRTVQLSNVTVIDEHGDRVLHLVDITVHLALPALVQALVDPTSSELFIQIPHIRAESAEVTLVTDRPHQSVTLAQALTPKPSPVPTGRTPDSARPTLVGLPSIEIGRIVGRFRIAGLEQLVPQLVAVHGSVQVTETGVAVSVQRFGITTAGLPAPVRGTATVRVDAPSSVNVQFSGFVGDSELQSAFAWREGTVEAQMASPRVTAATIHQFWPDWPLVEPLSFTARANGTFEQMDVEGKVTASPSAQIGDGRHSEIHLQGKIEIDEGMSATFSTQVSDLSLDLFGVEWPPSSLDANLDTSLTYDGTTLTQRTTGVVPATVIAEIPLPEVSFEVTTAAHQTELQAQINEPDARGHVRAVYLASGELMGSLDIPVIYLDRQRRLPQGMRGSANVQATGQLQNGQATLDGKVKISNFRTSDLQIGSATLGLRTVRTFAPSSQGTVHMNLAATGVAFKEVGFGKATAQATLTGDALRADISLSDADGRQLTAKGNYNFQTEQLTHVHVTAQRSDLVGQASLPLIDVNGPVVEVESLDIHRLNCTLPTCPEVRGRGRYSPGRLSAKVGAKRVALERLWPVLGLSSPLRGLVDADFDVQLDEERRHGSVSVSAQDVSFLGYPATTVELKARLTERYIDAQVAATNELGIAVAGRASGQLDGEPLALASWVGSTGTIELTGQLASLEPVRVIANLPNLRSLDGNVRAKLTAQRWTPGGYPTVNAELDVRDLAAEIETGDDSSLTLTKHRAYINSTLDAEHATLYASGVVEDAVGALLRFNGQLPLDLSTGLDLARKSPILLNGTIDPRELGTMPYFRSPLSGRLEGQLTVYGTLDAPEGKATLNLLNLTAPALDDQLPLSVQANLHYALPAGGLTCEILGITGRQTVVFGRAAGTVHPEEPTFHGSMRVALSQFPLWVLTPIADLDVDGSVSGIAEFADTPNRFVDIHMEVEELAASGQTLGTSSFEARAETGNAHATFEIQQGNDGVTVTVDAVASPTEFPTPAKLTEVHAQLRARRLNAAVFSPLLTGIVARLNGALDADVSLDWERAPETGEWSNRASGVAHLREGRAYVEGVGLEFQDVTLDVLATPFGEQTHIAFDRVQSRARSEVVNFEGRGQIILSGMDVVSGSANVALRDVPVTLQGLNLGKATGTVGAQLERRAEWDVAGPYFGKPYMLVNATLGNWQLRASPSASRSLIDTSANPDVTVLQGKKGEVEGEVVPFRIILDLGRDTQFSLADMDIPLSGETRIDYTDKAVTFGTLTLKRGGRVPILGHVFEVQNGALRLNPSQPSNPYIDIVLAGQAKDGTSVNVTLTGTMQEPLVSPPLGQLNELLGGGAATAVSGGVQALGVNALLGDTVQFRVGSDENDQDLARYSAAVQIRDSLWFEVNYARTETNAFRTDNNNAVSGTLDYRFNDNWSLRTEAGTTGGSVDVVWQYRY